MEYSLAYAMSAVRHRLYRFWFLTVIVPLPALAEPPAVIAVLENPQCKGSTPRAVRPLFASTPGGWISLTSGKLSRKYVSNTMTWTAAFHGEPLGKLTTTAPTQSISPAWNYPRDFLLSLTAGGVPVDTPNTERVFRGWCDAPNFRPILLSSLHGIGDPENWRPSIPLMTDTSLFMAFVETLKGSPLCRVDGETRRPYQPKQKDLLTLKRLVRSDGVQLIALSLSERYTSCGSELGEVSSPRWFVVDGTVRYLGDDMEYVDAGDFDGDGCSEILFWYSGYNRDGYILFSDNLQSRTEFIWSYH